MLLAIGLFLFVCGVVFVGAPLIKRPALTRLLELDGRFEAAASIFAGVLFLLSGGALLTGFEQPR
ncbi:MAG: hypothetical protein ABL308_08815 [Oceanicaulis sp.]